MLASVNQMVCDFVPFEDAYYKQGRHYDMHQRF